MLNYFLEVVNIRTLFLGEEIDKKNVKEIEISKDNLNGNKEEVEVDVVQILENEGIALTLSEVFSKSRFSKEEVKKTLEASKLIKKTSMGRAKEFFGFRKCPFGENPRTYLYYLEEKNLKSWARKHSYLF